MLIFQLIIVQVLIFGGLVFFLRKMMISSSYNETQRLQKLNAENVQKARDLEKKVNDAEYEYQDKIRRANEESKELKENAKQDAEHMKQIILAQAKKEKDFFVKQAMNSKEKVREEVVVEMKAQSVEYCCRMIQGVLNLKNQRFLHEGLVEDILEELINISAETFSQIEEKDNVEVRTAHVMSTQHKEKLKEILVAKINGKINIEEVLVKELVGGMVVQIGSLVFDGSLMTRLKKFN